MIESPRVAHANATFEVKFTKVDRGRDVYHAHIYIKGQRYGFVSQRRGGNYQAFVDNGRVIAEAGSLSQLREKVCEHYAMSDGTASPSLS